MNILVVGCGKVGSRLASLLSREGHDISVVDKFEENFEALAKDFHGFKTQGIPIDQDILRQAGIESCDALAAVSSDDNVNIMVSEMAKNIFKVPIVLARIYDPVREEVFQSFGLHTVCPTNLTVAAVRSAITERDIPSSINIDSHTINFSTEVVPRSLVGALASDILLSNNQSLFAIMQSDLSLVLYNGQKLKLGAGDKAIIATIVD